MPNTIDVSASMSDGFFGSLQPVTNRLVYPEQNLFTTSAYTQRTFRSVHVIREDTPFIVPVWANECSPVSVTGNDVTYKAAWEYVPAGTGNLNSIPVQPMTLMGGKLTHTAPFGTLVIGDPIFGPFRRGDLLLIRTCVSVASTGLKWPIGMTLNWSWDGDAAGDATATPNYQLSFTAIGAGVSPCMILGQPRIARATVCVAGDSIHDGAGDNGAGPYNNLGPATRAFDTAQIAHTKVAAPGERVAQVIVTPAYKLRGIIAAQAKNIFSNYGTNDLGNGDTVATIQASMIAYWRMWPARRVFQSTLDPKTTSTDSWATTANQTVTSYEAVRTGINTWLRAGAPIVNGAAVAIGTAGALTAGQAGHPLYLVADTAAVVEVDNSNTLTLNGGKWIVNGSANYPTNDGIHNSAATSQLKAAVITASMIPLLAA